MRQNMSQNTIKLVLCWPATAKMGHRLDLYTQWDSIEKENTWFFCCCWEQLSVGDSLQTIHFICEDRVCHSHQVGEAGVATETQGCAHPLLPPQHWISSGRHHAWFFVLLVLQFELTFPMLASTLLSKSSPTQGHLHMKKKYVPLPSRQIRSGTK